jgi:hypothetical protein
MHGHSFSTSYAKGFLPNCCLILRWAESFLTSDMHKLCGFLQL